MKVANLHLRGVILPVLEYATVKEFIEAMKNVTEKTEYRLIIAKNGRIVLQPCVSTSRKNVLLLREFSPDDVGDIRKAAHKLSNIKKPFIEVKNFFFDEKREPFSPALQ